MSREDIAGVLNSLRLFRGADAAFFARLAQQPRARRQIGADELIYEAGDPADAVFAAFPADAAAIGPRAIVELTLPTGDAGAQVHVEHVVAGDVFGEFELVAAGLIDGRIARRSSARALVACDLYRIPFSLLAPVLADVEAVRGRLIRLSMDRLIAALNVRSTHLLGDRDIALANWLVDAADNLGIAEGRHVRFPRAIGQREIAEALGVSRETISLRLNEWERAGLLNTGGQSQRFEILDYPRVALRAAIRRGDVAGALTDALAEIDADLDHGELVRARNVALDMLMFFPASPDLRHRIALASMRAGAVREAVDVLAHGGYATGGDIDLLRDRVRLGLRHAATAPARLFFGSGEPPDDGESSEADQAREPILIEDIAAIEARARKEMAFAARDDAARRRYAAISARLYGNIFDATGGYYAGINTAVMARVAGDIEQAGSVARRVLAGLGNAPKGYWPSATLGEARLLLGDEAAALDAFADAAGQDDATDGKLSSTRLQARRIGDHLAIAVDKVFERLPVGRTAVYSGGPLAGGRFDDEEAVRPLIESALAAENVRYAFGSLACGGDIVIAEAALAAGCELHVVLPFPVEDVVKAFADSAATAADTASWSERFRSCLNRSTSLIVAVEPAPPKHAIASSVRHGLSLAAGLALLRADMLTATSVMLAVKGANAATPPGIRTWAASGRPLIEIPGASEAPDAIDDGPDVFAPVVFLWPLDSPVDLAGLCEVVAAETGHRLDLVPRTSRDRRSGAAIPLSDVGTALDVVDALARQSRAARTPIRLIADFGPVIDARSRISDTLISRLSGASDLIGFPPLTPLATISFAAQARLEAGDRIGLVPIGRTAPGPAADSRPLAAREVYALYFAGQSDARYSLDIVSLIQG